MSPALIWLVFALGLAGAEALTGDMFLLMLSGGALSAAVISWLTGWPLWADGVVFLVISVLLLVLVRPALRRRMWSGTGTETGTRALEGKPAVVLYRVAHNGGGRVKLGGEVWTARSLTHGDVFEPGEQVIVEHIDGATAVVTRVL
ncbi:NfeD family protein [Mycolicibacter minnesotensis]